MARQLSVHSDSPSPGCRRSSPRQSVESGVASARGSVDGINNSDEVSEDDVFGQAHSRAARLSGDSGIADLFNRRRRTKSDECSSRNRILLLKDDMRAFLSSKTRRVDAFANVSSRTRSQSIAEEGEYQFDRKAAQSSDAEPDRPRRNSDQGRVRLPSDLEPGVSGVRKRSGVRNFLENFRSRAKSENQQTMSKPKKQLDVAIDDADGSGQLGTIRQGEQMEAGTRRRSHSPVGDLMNRLRQLKTEPERRRRNSGNPPVQGLPHPSDMPLDHSFCADLAEEKRARLRKTSSVDDSAVTKFSFPPQPGHIHERHRDLFENLSHSADVEGQCTILSPTALAESHRTRRMSGPSMSVPDGGRQRAASGSEVQVTENEKYIIFRSKCHAEGSTPDIHELAVKSKVQPDSVFEIFVRGHRCYDVLPISSKLLVFDNNLNVRKAFFALVYNGLRSAPLWDSTQQKFVGMLTVTDFIHILQNHYRSSLAPKDDLETHKISTWRSHLKSRLRPLQWISPEASLYDAVRLLLHARVHRLPVLDPRTGNALFIMTHKRILKYIFLYQHQLPMPRWLRCSVGSLKVGTFDGVVTVSQSTTVINALGLFVQHRISALPVLDAEDRLVDIYSKFDVINLAATKTYNNLEVSVGEALKYRQERFEGVETCTKDDSMLSVMQQLVRAEVHRLVMVDSSKRVVGVVSLSDILEAVVLHHERLSAASKSIPSH